MPDKESDIRTRQIKIVILIRLHKSTMNRDQGVYTLSRINDPVFTTLTEKGENFRISTKSFNVRSVKQITADVLRRITGSGG